MPASLADYVAAVCPAAFYLAVASQTSTSVSVVGPAANYLADASLPGLSLLQLEIQLLLQIHHIQSERTIIKNRRNDLHTYVRHFFRGLFEFLTFVK